jgi:hypothetical protein
MKIDEIRSMVSDLADVEPKTFGTDKDADEAAQWVDIAKKTEAEAEALLDPAIKEAFAAHKKLTGQKKSLLEKLSAAKDRVRVNLANWIAGGHDVKGCHIQKKFRFKVIDQCLLPNEFLMTVPDMDGLQKWVDQTEGKVPVPGVNIEQVNILFAREQ